MASTVDRSVSFPVRTNGSSTNYLTSSSPSSYVDPSQLSAGIITATRTRTGQRLAKWHAVIESGGNATTPLTGRWDSMDTNDVRWRVLGYQGTDSSKWNNRELRGSLLLKNNQFTSSGVAPNVSTNFADNLARAKFYKRLRELTIQMSGGTFLGELRQTLHMLRRPASALWSKNLGYLDALNKRKRASPKHWAKSVGGLWLEHSFGWMPLFHDVNDAIKAYERLIAEQERKTKVLSAGGAMSFDRSPSLALRIGEVTFQNTVRTRYEARLYETHFVRYKGAIKAQVETTRWDNYKLFGLTAEDIVPTAWELLPWSFLVDYFTNIGDILSSVSTSTANVRWVNKTVIAQTEFKSRAKLDPARTALIEGAPYRVVLSSGQDAVLEFKRRHVTRSANSGISPPRFQMSLGLSNKQLFNVAALLTQARALHPQNPRPHRFR